MSPGNSGGCKPTSALIYTFIKCYDNIHEQGNNLSGNASEKKKRQRLVKYIEADTFQMDFER